MHNSFTFFHYALLAAYVLASTGIGLWFARSQKSIETYFLAERSAPSWVVSISIISSDITAVSYLGTAAFVLTGDLQLLVGALAAPFAALFVALLFVPHLARQNVYTVYEYMERRFNLQVRTVASALFVFTRGSHLAVALYAASLVLSELMGISIWGGLLILGGLTTVYTVFGGMKAVLWTDVIQFFVLMGGVVGVLIGVAIAFKWDFATIWRLAANPTAATLPWLGGKPDLVSHTHAFEFGFSFTQLNFWSVILWTFLQFVGSYGSDQVLVQRYLAAGSRTKMALSLVGGGFLVVPVNLLLFATGIFLVAYYSHFIGTAGYEWVGTLADPNNVMTHFISHGLPGILGAIVIAGLFAGTMSSFSAGLNSLSTATYVDFFMRFRKPAMVEKHGVRRAKLITCAWGIIVMVSASLLGGGDTIFAIIAKVMSPFAGPLLGIFLLGMLSNRANTFGVIAGAILGVLATVFVTYFTTIHWTWYFVVGSVSVLVLGYVLSFFRPAPSAENVLPVGRI